MKLVEFYCFSPLGRPRGMSCGSTELLISLISRTVFKQLWVTTPRRAAAWTPRRPASTWPSWSPASSRSRTASTFPRRSVCGLRSTRVWSRSPWWRNGVTLWRVLTNVSRSDYSRIIWRKYHICFHQAAKEGQCPGSCKEHEVGDDVLDVSQVSIIIRTVKRPKIKLLLNFHIFLRSFSKI